MKPTDSDCWRPTASLERLRYRAELLRTLRQRFHESGYWEVETPLLSHDVCIDAWIDPFLVARDAAEQPLYLQPSPEFAHKRLLAAGADAIYEITRSFRRGESGGRHNPEFTIVEWYRRGVTYHEQMDFVTELVIRPHLGQNVTPARIRYDDAFLQFAGQRAWQQTPRQLAGWATERGVPIPPRMGEDRDQWLNLLWAELVEPQLAPLGTVFIYDYPHTQAALARIRPDDPPVAERFELYWNGLEICNGYQELTDPVALEQRMRRQQQLRQKAGLDPLKVDSRLLEAMQHGLPECAGVAMGFDRLLLALLGDANIESVTAFPFPRA